MKKIRFKQQSQQGASSKRATPNTDFARHVFSIVAKIPAGKTLTYKEVAAIAGRPGAHRAVGSILSTNYNPSIPCHRVIRSDGKMGGYNRGGEGVKRRKLKLEAESTA